MLDFSETREEDPSMKYHSFYSLILVLVLSAEVNSQGQLSNSASNKSCEQYKIGIITPSKDIDYKLRIIVPPKNIDEGIVFNPCPEQSQVAFAPPVILHRKTTKEFFKVPPFTIKNKYPKE